MIQVINEEAEEGELEEAEEGGESEENEANNLVLELSADLEEEEQPSQKKKPTIVENTRKKVERRKRSRKASMGRSPQICTVAKMGCQNQIDLYRWLLRLI